MNNETNLLQQKVAELEAEVALHRAAPKPDDEPVYLPKITPDMKEDWNCPTLLMDTEGWTQDAVDFAAMLNQHRLPKPDDERKRTMITETPVLRVPPEDDDELARLEAEKAELLKYSPSAELFERLKAAEAEVARLKMTLDEYELLHRCDCCDCLTEDAITIEDHTQCPSCSALWKATARAQAAEAKLRAVGELPRHRMDIIDGNYYPVVDQARGQWIRACELEALLNK